MSIMDENTYEVQEVKLDSFSLWKLTTTHTFKSDYYFKLGIDNIFNFTDKSGGYNNGTPGLTVFVGLGLKI